MFRALPRFEVPGSGGVLASRGSAGQGRLFGRGVEPGGGIAGWDQAIWNRSNDRAGDRGGARAGKPRWMRILAITEGCSMAAMIFKGPPQWGQCSISILSTRLSSRAQLRRAGAAGGASAGSAESL
jgi:hypothetical protein